MTSRQETRSSRRWILVALLVFLLCLVLWIAAAFILNIAFAESLPFSLNLRSRLAANYAPDEFIGSLGIFRLSIIDEILLDRGLSPEEAEEQSEKIKVAMSSPVPTATARDFKGNEPFTATPTELPTATITVSPTETPTLTSTLMMVMTATNTPKPATETLAVPTNTPPSGPSPTPTKCLVDPIAQILVPPDGEVYTLADDLPAEAFAYDPDNVDPDTCQPIGVYPSDNGVGINRVEFEIWWLDGVPDVLVHSQVQLSVKYCGFTGTTSCDTFSVNNSTWPGGEPVNGGWHKIKARARDDGGHWSNWAEAEFYLDIGPTPTPSYTPVNTSTYTPTPTRTSTPTPTGTYTPTPTSTSTPTPNPDVCSNISFTNFTLTGINNNITWDIYNSNGFTVMLTHMNLTWPTGNGMLNEIQIGSSYSWSGSDAPPNADRDVNGSILYPGPTELRVRFGSSSASTGYILIATFEYGACTITVNE